MSSICLGTIESYLFSDGSESVKKSISFLESLSFMVPETSKHRYDLYIAAAYKFSVMCSDFLDITTKNKNFIVYKILIEFVKKYPKSKQNLANPAELTQSVLNYYLMQRHNLKSYKPETDIILKFIKDNSVNIYNSIVIITNVMRARSLIQPIRAPK